MYNYVHATYMLISSIPLAIIVPLSLAVVRVFSLSLSRCISLLSFGRVFPIPFQDGGNKYNKTFNACSNWLQRRGRTISERGAAGEAVDR